MVKQKQKGIIKLLAFILIGVVAGMGYWGLSGGGDPATQPTTAITATTDALLQVLYIDVGQGDSMLIKTPEGKVILVDSGEPGDFDEVQQAMGQLDAKSIDLAIATHPHSDHIGSMAKVIMNYDIGQFMMPAVTANTEVFEGVLDALEQKGMKFKSPNPEDTMELGGVTLRFLGPLKEYENMNDNSIVFKLVYGKTSFLFVGDCEADAEKDMMNIGLDLSANILKVGHHGSNTSTSEEFLLRVNPAAAVISCGVNNKNGHPNQETLDKLNALGVTIYRTDTMGSILLVSDGAQVHKMALPE